MNDEMMLDGKTAIVTGSNRGIGKKIVEMFSESGASIYACARSKSEEFESYLTELSKSTNTKISPCYFDLSDSEDIKKGISWIVSDADKIDILVNNAGIADGGSFLMTPMNRLRTCFEINYFAQVQIMQLVARKMIRQNSGSIINMASVSGIEHRPGHLSYGSSKAALIWASQLAAKEFGGYNIRVNAIAPAVVDTDMGHFRDDDSLEKILQETPLSRMASTEEIGKVVLFLASDSSSFITGDVIKVDGGRF